MMANAQGSNIMENHNSEFYKKTLICECGYEVSKICTAIIPVQKCPDCSGRLCTSNNAKPNNFTTLSFTSKAYPPEYNLIYHTNTVNCKQNNSYVGISDQVYNMKYENSDIVEELKSTPTVSNESYNDTGLSHIQTIYSSDIESTKKISNIRKHPNKIDLFEDLPIQVICLSLMCLLIVCLTYFGILSFRKWNDCPGEEKIPLYLLVECFCGILLLIQISNSILANNFSYFHMFICVLGLVFQLAWSVPGYLWIYGFSFDQINLAALNLTSSGHLCDHKLYTTAYWVLNCSSLINGLIFTCLCVYLIIISKPLLGIIEVVMGTLISIFISMVLIGFLKSSNCPFNMYLPVYVTVTGMCGLVSSSYIFRTLTYSESDNNKNYSLLGKTEDDAFGRATVNKCDMIIYISYGLFHLVWFSIGCNLVFWSEEPEFVLHNDKYCDHTFYMFIYCILSIIALIIGTILICTFSFIAMFLFAIFCTFMYII